jgi:hypothetical protein
MSPRTQSSISESLNFQSRPILCAGRRRPSIQRYTDSLATPRCLATSSTDTHGSAGIERGSLISIWQIRVPEAISASKSRRKSKRGGLLASSSRARHRTALDEGQPPTDGRLRPRHLQPGRARADAGRLRCGVGRRGVHRSAPRRDHRQISLRALGIFINVPFSIAAAALLENVERRRHSLKLAGAGLLALGLAVLLFGTGGWTASAIAPAVSLLARLPFLIPKCREREEKCEIGSMCRTACPTVDRRAPGQS